MQIKFDVRAKRLLSIAPILVAIIASTAPVQAQESEYISMASYDDLMTRVSMLEADRAELKANQGSRDVVSNHVTKSGWFAGYEAVIVQQFNSHNTAFVVMDTGVIPGTSNTTVDFDWEMEFSNRLELGYLNSCKNLGFRTRYWAFDSNASAASGPTQEASLAFASDPDLYHQPGFGIPITVAAQSELDVIDFEAISKRGIWGNELTLGAGLRYAGVDHHSVAIRTDNNDRMVYDSQFDGVGPTIALESRRPFGNSGIGFLVGTRGSVLFGTSDLIVTMDDDSDGVLNDQFDSLDRTRFMSTAELNLGLDYRRRVGRGQLDLGVGLESQLWFGGGTPAISQNSGSRTTGTYLDRRRESLGFVGIALNAAYAF